MPKKNGYVNDVVGAQGEKGELGPKGPPGPHGEKGTRGKQGKKVRVSTGVLQSKKHIHYVLTEN